MTSSSLIRLSGLASVLGGLWWALAMAYHGVREMLMVSEETDAIEKLSVLPLLLLVMGLVGFHATQAERSGWLGWTGFLITFIGFAVALVGAIGDLWFALATGGPIFFVGFVIVFVGLVLLGSATLRAKVLPRWRWLPFIMGLLGLVLFVSGSIVGGLGFVLWLLVSWFLVWALFGTGWVLLGFMLWAEASEIADQSSPGMEEVPG